MYSEPVQKNQILVVDHNGATLDVLKRNLVSKGYAVYSVQSANDAVNTLETMAVNLVITGMVLPEYRGVDLLRHIKENYRDVETIVITDNPSIEGAVESVKAGAGEYIPRAGAESELFAAVERTLDKQNMHRTVSTPGAPEAFPAYGILGESSAMRALYKSVRKAASVSVTTLITGESGTGKELVARAIHYHSKRASKPFIPVNCGGIPETLLESELFGYVKGAFTGANESRAGFFQTADGGTIFLDEIGETSLAMQVKLLRVLQDKQVRMIGDSHARLLDVRIIAATNKDLKAQISKGMFREDLYFRINVIGIEIPPLRERGNDIFLLINHFSSKFAQEIGKTAPRFSDKALEVLRGYRWPGNVRELENVIQRIVLMSEDECIDAPDLPSLMRFSALRSNGCERTLADVEAEYIRHVLIKVNGNKTRASEILQIDRKTLREKLKKHKLNA